MFGKYWWVIPCLIAIGFTVRYYYIKCSRKRYSKPADKGEAYLAMVFSWWFLGGCVMGHFI